MIFAHTEGSLSDFELLISRSAGRNEQYDMGFNLQAKSKVTPNGVPSSSFRAYRLPIDVLESSTLENTPAFRNLDADRDIFSG